MGIGVIFYNNIMAEENLEEEVVAEEATEETPEVQLPSEEILEQIFEVVSGTEFNEADQGHVAVMQQIVLLLQQDPELSQELASGDMTVSQFALKLYRDMEEQAGGEEEME